MSLMLARTEYSVCEGFPEGVEFDELFYDIGEDRRDSPRPSYELTDAEEELFDAVNEDSVDRAQRIVKRIMSSGAKIRFSVGKTLKVTDSDGRIVVVRQLTSLGHCAS